MRPVVYIHVLASTIGLVTSQSLATCAQSCVHRTKTKCDSTNYACACTDNNYIDKLVTCFGKGCSEADAHDANWYLSSLCNAVGAPLYAADTGTGRLEVPSEQIRLQLRRVEYRQEATGTQGGLPFPIPTATPSPTSSAGSGTIAGDNTSSDNSSGLSIGAKIGLGVGIPLGALLIGLAIFFAMRFRSRKAKLQAAHAANAQLPTYSFAPGQTNINQQEGVPYNKSGYAMPPELSQSAQFHGYEMATLHGNTHELPGESAVVRPAEMGGGLGSLRRR